MNLFEFRFKIPSVILKRCLHIDRTLSNIYLKKVLLIKQIMDFLFENALILSKYWRTWNIKKIKLPYFSKYVVESITLWWWWRWWVRSMNNDIFFFIFISSYKHCCRLSFNTFIWAILWQKNHKQKERSRNISTLLKYMFIPVNCKLPNHAKNAVKYHVGNLLTTASNQSVLFCNLSRHTQTTNSR